MALLTLGRRVNVYPYLEVNTNLSGMGNENPVPDDIFLHLTNVRE